MTRCDTTGDELRMDLGRRAAVAANERDHVQPELALAVSAMRRLS